MRGFFPGAVVCALALIVASCSEPPQDTGAAQPAADTAAPAAEAPVEDATDVAAADPDADIAPGAGASEPTGGGFPMAPGNSEPPTDGQGSPIEPPPPPPPAAAVAPMPPAVYPSVAYPSAPSSMPPAAANGHGPSAMPPVAANGHSGNKVLSYFQKARTTIDPNRAFGFVLMPKVAVTDQDKRAQKDFCTTVLATMDFMTPGAVAASAPRDVLATYWPIVGSRESYEIKHAFSERNCDELIAWYDYTLARALAAKAGVAELSGPLLITWPSAGADGATARDPLIVDFSKANQERAAKALQYWFRQVKARPELWTNRIREGTIRAELADAVNDTAGVLLTVMAGKWDSLTVVASANATPR